MATKTSYKVRLERIRFFFPVQLFLLNLKRNHFLLIFWLLLLGYTTGFFAKKYGVYHLFLYPEYAGSANFGSFFMVGFGLGGFIMAFNIYSYVIHAFRFPFLATLSRPFFKFSINNFIIPIMYTTVYLVYSIGYQIDIEFISKFDVFLNILGFLCGGTIFVLLSFLYFFNTNKDIYKFLGKTEEEATKESEKQHAPQPVIRKRTRWYFTRDNRRVWRVLTYLQSPISISLAREGSHYDKDMLRKVFSQNHINATIFELLVVFSFILVGALGSNKFFQIPAATSIFLSFTMFLMVISVFMSWLKGWTLSILVVLFLILNYASSNYAFFNAENQAYGLNYMQHKAKYDFTLEMISDKQTAQYNADKKHMHGILETWKAKNQKFYKKGKKPKLVIVNASGGGLRSAMWTYHSLSYADSILQGRLLSQTHLFTGSSGGIIGASYLREMYLQSQLFDSVVVKDKAYLKNIGNDILSPILFSFATNDIFIRYKSFNVGNFNYKKDRGYAFEQQLNENTNNVLNKTLKEYAKPEASSMIPLIFMAPTIVGDGRKLLISSQPISYMTFNKSESKVSNVPLVENIEFLRFFKNQDAENLLFTSALRMNATFPYITPIVTLPSDPAIQVMDAGIRDNYGTTNAFKFLYVFNDWIEENTSGVILLEVRDKNKDFEVQKNRHRSYIDRMISPVGTLYGNFFKFQDYGNDQMVQYASAWFKSKLDIVSFQLSQEYNNISLSWHLTNFEKKRIEEAIYLPRNKEALNKLHILMNDGALLKKE